MTVERSDFTGGEVAGNGIFDELMRTVKAHLIVERDAGRITGSDYTNAYISALQAAMSTGANFVLSRAQVNQQLLVQTAQISQIERQTALVDAQIERTEADTLIAAQQRLQLVEQTALAAQQTALVVRQQAQIDNGIAQGNAQIEVINNQRDQLEQDTLLTRQNVINTTNTNTTITRQQDKLTAEIAVLNQRRLTEQAQISDQIDGADVAGVLGRQIALYGAQTAGFSRDAEQKLAKIMVDTWTVRQTTDGATTTTAGLEDASIKAVLDQAFVGVGLVPD